MQFSLGTFSADGGALFPGVIRGEQVIPLAGLGPALQRLGLRIAGVESVFALISSGWESNFRALAAVISLEGPAPASVPLDRLRVHAPLQAPRQIFCSIGNYRSHLLDQVRDPGASPGLDEQDTPECLARAAQLADDRLRGAPYVCFKLPSTVIGPSEPLQIPRDARCTDWELELGVVIGTPCRRVARADAMRMIAGYMLVNDITVRELVIRSDWPRLASDWLQSKNSPGFLPTGPYFVPAAFLPDPYALRLTLALNGEVMQNELVSDMLFDIATQLEYISRYAQLLPGDLICTGTPAGCGTRYQRFLKPGDVMESSAPGFGVQRTPCIAETI